jgi:opacity protein-like surface antigen
VFEAGGSYKTLRETVTEQGVTLTAKGDFRLHQFMGGLRVKGPSRAVTPFAQFLAGGVHLTGNASGTFDGLSFDVSHSATDFVTQIGGGVTFGLSERVRMRAAGDYLRIFEEDAGVNAFRFAVGAVFPF